MSEFHSSGSDSDVLACDRCGHRIGVYEPMVWRRPDGEMLLTGFLSVRDHSDLGHADSQFFHPACLEPTD